MKKSEAESDHKPKYDKKVDSYRLDKETIYQNLSKYLIDIISQLQIKAQVKNIKIAKKKCLYWI